MGFYNDKLSRISSYFIDFKKQISSDIENYTLSLPETFLEEMTFELIYNIRKHIIQSRDDVINKECKLIIKTEIKNINGAIYLSIANNTFDLDVDSSHINRSIKNKKGKHGLNLLNEIITNYSNKNIFAEINDNLLVLNIPLTKKTNNHE